MPDQTPSMPPLPDRELLELAARAAGIKISATDQARRDAAGYGHIGLWTHDSTCWNPLTADDDALRLAAKLRIDIEWQNVGAFPSESVEAYHRDGDHGYFCASEHENDYRRAIVRAAAEIGARISTLSLAGPK